MKSAALGFFKKNGISYFVASKEDLTFTCFVCSKPAYMTINDTNWYCPECEHEGTLVDLIEFQQNNISPSETAKVFNSRQERQWVNRAFCDLIQISNNESHSKRIMKLQERVNTLLDYHIYRR